MGRKQPFHFPLEHSFPLDKPSAPSTQLDKLPTNNYNQGLTFWKGLEYIDGHLQRAAGRPEVESYLA